MRICDLHADIGMDVLAKIKNGETDVLRNHHIPKLTAGEVGCVGMACFFEGFETMDDLTSMVSSLRQEILSNPDTLNFYTGKELSPNKINAMMTIEGMCMIQRDVQQTLTWCYDQGVRIGSLSWNDQNALSTGVKGDPSRGLTPLGIEAIRTMNRLKMIVDVSHASQKSFWDILAVSEAPVIATHSNSRSLCDSARNLTDEQILAIARKGGLIGLVAARHFISSDASNQTSDKLAKHARHIADLAGIDVLSIGFDFMDFLNPPFGKSAMALDLQDASQSQNLVRALRDNGFSSDQIEQIAWKNAQRFFSENL